MIRTLYEILAEVAAQPTRGMRIEALRKAAGTSAVIPPLLKYTFDGDIKWLLPDSDPPFNPNKFPDQENNFPREIRKLYLFIDGGHPSLTQIKREQHFINMLETIEPNDTQILLSMKARRLPFDQIDAHLVNEAFPGLLNSLAKPKPRTAAQQITVPPDLANQPPVEDSPFTMTQEQVDAIMASQVSDVAKADLIEHVQVETVKRKRGRPKGSPNKKKEPQES